MASTQLASYLRIEERELEAGSAVRVRVGCAPSKGSRHSGRSRAAGRILKHFSSSLGREKALTMREGGSHLSLRFHGSLDGEPGVPPGLRREAAKSHRSPARCEV
jgi:hypothetical protein